MAKTLRSVRSCKPRPCVRSRRGRPAGGRGALCGRDHAGHGRADRSRRPGRSDRPPVRARRARAAASRRGTAPTRSATSAHARARHRAPLSGPRAAQAHARLPGLLPLLLPPRNGRPGGRRRFRRDALDAALAYIAARPAHPRGDPHRRRPAHAVAAPHRRGHARARRDRRTSRCCAGTRACRWSTPSASRPTSSRRCAPPTARRLRRLHANHPARADRRGARRLRAPRRRRHPARQPDRAAEGRQRRRRDRWRR